jgi:Transposase IS116/IS110/IS902 family
MAEIGVDMGGFPTAGHLSSWVGMAPGNNITSGKCRSGTTTKSGFWLAVTSLSAHGLQRGAALPTSLRSFGDYASGLGENERPSPSALNPGNHHAPSVSTSARIPSECTRVAC